MNKKLYWIWVQTALGISPSVRTDQIFTYFGNAEKLYYAGEYEWRISGAFTPGQIDKMSDAKLDKAEAIIEECDKYGIKIVTPDDGDYPSLLFKLPNLPSALYVRGDLDCLKNKISIAVVGARKASDNGQRISRALCGSLSRSGAVIVSGAAKGIDAAAHLGAMDAGGKTVAVLGCGFGANYLPENEALRRQIADNGALVTEYPPRTPARGENFPFRNRIISGLSHGTVVIEANDKSGSLRTVEHATIQGRDVFAVPGDITSSMNMGTNRLLRDGAKPVFNAMDILEDYAKRYPTIIKEKDIETELVFEAPRTKPSVPERKKQQFQKSAVPNEVSVNAKLICEAFDSEVMQAEDLIIKTNLNTVDFFSAVTELELYGIIEPLAGKKYKINQ